MGKGLFICPNMSCSERLFVIKVQYLSEVGPLVHLLEKKSMCSTGMCSTVDSCF